MGGQVGGYKPALETFLHNSRLYLSRLGRSLLKSQEVARRDQSCLDELSMLVDLQSLLSWGNRVVRKM